MNASRVTASVMCIAALGALVLASEARAADAGRVAIVHRVEPAAPGRLPRVEISFVRVSPEMVARRELPRVEVAGRSVAAPTVLLAHRPVRAVRTVAPV